MPPPRMRRQPEPPEDEPSPAPKKYDPRRDPATQAKSPGEAPTPKKTAEPRTFSVGRPFAPKGESPPRKKRELHLFGFGRMLGFVKEPDEPAQVPPP